VWLEGYRSTVEQFRSALEDKRIGVLPDLAANVRPLAAKIWRTFEDLPDDEIDYDALAFQLVACSLELALLREGFEFHAPPGEPIQCVRGGVRFVPFDEVGAIVAKDESPRALSDKLVAAGLAGKPLVTTADTPAPERDEAQGSPSSPPA